MTDLERIAELERLNREPHLSPTPLTVEGNEEYAWIKERKLIDLSGENYKVHHDGTS